MPPDILALSRMQIERFFKRNGLSVTQEQCDAEAQRWTTQPVTATPSQGGTSYTVEGGSHLVVQFRLPTSTLDINLLRSIEQAYDGFVPRHEYRGQLDQLSIYTMNNLGGRCLYLARDELLANDSLLRVTLDDYARFFVSAFSKTPILIERPNSIDLSNKYLSQLQQLRVELPSRFHAILDDLMPQVSDLFVEDWPLVPNHTDLLENNIHVDPVTGQITGICDWREAEISPFGMSLGGLEIMLGFPVKGDEVWRYRPNHKSLRQYFWGRFYHYLGDASDQQKRRIETARLVGLFRTYALEYGKPATEQSPDLRILGALILQ
ncbi:uncharacterized protein L203_103340 [Cryptococcus depauperatus CBS 7841]|uniref:Aminoglycoside phosphotransferase domain-containing protein n=1 Tax=Cryptococcus depauperatus CBS 7841 TaxID=1295531 RepID=A0A1E3I1U8_9TREE|nr:hypothetical protein L203_05373 [Cryptococcus depauperatus CBS 7841]